MIYLLSTRRSRTQVAALIAFVLLSAVGCTKSEEAVDFPTNPPRSSAKKDLALPYPQEIAEWQANRTTRLKAEGGWLSVVGLNWLKDGDNTFGTDRSSDIVFPSGPARGGILRLQKGVVTLIPDQAADLRIEGQPAGQVKLSPDTSEKPTTMTTGSLSFFLIDRGGKIGLRLKDTEAAGRKNFKGLAYYPVDPEWKVEARFEAYQPVKSIPIQNIVGMVDNLPSPGALVFTLAGKEYRLDPVVEEGSDELFIIFRDKTSGRETYGAGRYLYAKMPVAGGAVTVDFNKAYNPPCAFTDFATCPLPPLQNRLDLAVTAGEKKYDGHPDKTAG